MDPTFKGITTRLLCLLHTHYFPKKWTRLLRGLRQFILLLSIFTFVEEMDPTFKGITTYAERTYIFTFYLEEMDPTFKGITTHFQLSFQVHQMEEMDPTFKGITTWNFHFLSPSKFQEEMDPTFKGITTSSFQSTVGMIESEKKWTRLLRGLRPF